MRKGREGRLMRMLTAVIFAWREGGMGVDAMGLRFESNPETGRLGACTFR